MKSKSTYLLKSEDVCSPSQRHPRKSPGVNLRWRSRCDRVGRDLAGLRPSDAACLTGMAFRGAKRWRLNFGILRLKSCFEPMFKGIWRVRVVRLHAHCKLHSPFDGPATAQPLAGSMALEVSELQLMCPPKTNSQQRSWELPPLQRQQIWSEMDG